MYVSHPRLSFNRGLNESKRNVTMLESVSIVTSFSTVKRVSAESSKPNTDYQ
jgi:hypothetical protein